MDIYEGILATINTLALMLITRQLILIRFELQDRSVGQMMEAIRQKFGGKYD